MAIGICSITYVVRILIAFCPIAIVSAIDHIHDSDRQRSYSYRFGNIGQSVFDLFLIVIAHPFIDLFSVLICMFGRLVYSFSRARNRFTDVSKALFDLRFIFLNDARRRIPYTVYRLAKRIAGKLRCFLPANNASNAKICAFTKSVAWGDDRHRS
ncbi:hypothetical protein [Bacillus alveayuensis]|uniref:hypothetical protein n=1 Tax=Aeribacillus alveayuensis TaxID=279215 RepID=UPI00126A1E11|nr:hypothetical protein [Bacillus alveayuensis]